MSFSDSQKWIVLFGAVLFLLGLLQGGVVQSFHNPRMALSAHLTAVQGGTAVMVAGAVWSAVLLGPWFDRLARWLIIVSMYVLWLGLTAAAATGASEVLPIAGEGYSASVAIERMVSVAILGASKMMILGWTLVVIGVFRSIRAPRGMS